MAFKLFYIIILFALTNISKGQTTIWSEDFEATGNDTYTSNTSSISGLPEWEYNNTKTFMKNKSPRHKRTRYRFGKRLFYTFQGTGN